MSFSLVHFHTHLFLYDKSGNKQFDLTSDYRGDNSQSVPTKDGIIEFSYQFSNQPQPEDTTITLHNLTRADSKKFKKDCTVSIWAGWENSNWTQSNVRHIFTSTIDEVSPVQNNGGDWPIQITCHDGRKFSNETTLSKLYKKESKSIRSDASISNLSSSGRRQIRKIERQYGIRGNKIGAIKKALGPKERSQKSELSKLEKSAKSKIMSEYPTEHLGHHGKRGSGEKSHNHQMVEARKSARQAITAKFKNKRSEIQNEFKSARDTLEGRRKSNTRKKQRAVRKVRTQTAAKRQRARRAKNAKKSKSRKTKTSGLHFKKNTKASTIIKKLAKIGHIPISHLKLVHDKKYTNGYTATKTPWAEIQNIAIGDCNSNIWWPHGDIYIGNFAKQKQLNFTLTPVSGLIQTPQIEDDGDTDDNDDSSTSTKQAKKDAEANPPKYQITSVFLPFLTTGATFGVMDPASELYGFHSDTINAGDLFKGIIVTESGTLEVQYGSMPQAQFDVQFKSALQKAQSMKLNEQEKKTRLKEAKDKHHRKRIHIKRAKRSHIRRHARA